MSDMKLRTKAARHVATCVGQPGLRNDLEIGTDETFVILLSTDLVSDLMERTAQYGAMTVRLAIYYPEQARLSFAKFTHLDDRQSSEVVMGGSPISMLLDAAQTAGQDGFAFTYAGAGSVGAGSSAQVDNVVMDDEDHDLLV